MNTRLLASLIAMALGASAAMAQDQAAPPRGADSRGHEPPPQAYEDCRGKKAGDLIMHTTPEGKVSATCADSPKGLVARPRQPRGPAPVGADAAGVRRGNSANP